jgi:thiamine-monophosphate kinase
VVLGGIVLSSDMSVEGVHFRREWLSHREIGYRAAAAALSDLAAMGARPIGVLASLAIPEQDAGDPVTEVMAGVSEAVARLGGVVLGGDVTLSPGPLVVDVTVVGESAAPIPRSGARPGHELWVTGELGGGAAVVRQLLAGHDPDPAARPRFAEPTPRTREAAWLAGQGIPTAMIDLSDGLAGDAAHLAAASGVALVLEPAAVPVHPAAGSGEEGLRLALTGGEDYEVLFTAAPGTVAAAQAGFEARFGVRLTRVGRVVAGEGVLHDDGSTLRPLALSGFQHFHE